MVWTKITLGLSCGDFLSLGPLETKICVFSDGLSENAWKRLTWKRSQNIPGNDQLGFPEPVLFCMLENGPRGMFWTVVAQFGPPGTPRKSAFFQEKGQKRMKKWGEVTFMKEWMEALYVAVILALTDLRYLVSFPRYGRLKKKCWYKQICNGTYWLLLTGHFGPVFIRPSQWSITAVLWHCIALS